MRLNSFINKQKPFGQYRNSLVLLVLVVMGLFLLKGCKSKLTAIESTTKPVLDGTEVVLDVNPSPAVQFEIHHINVNNGDASVIRILHKDGTETKVLIDGGQAKPTEYLLPYINAMFNDTAFEYTVLTHYHNDHYNGLVALGNGSITSKYYIDLGGYNMSTYVDPATLPNIQPKDSTCPWTDVHGIFGGIGLQGYLEAIGTAAKEHGLKRYPPMSKDTANIRNMVGVQIPLAQFDSNGVPVTISLRSVAAWGYTQANDEIVDNWNGVGSAGKNDPTLGFVLECGEFRYFFGGDMGGSSDGNYINQETTLAQGFSFLYQGSKSYYNSASVPVDGHVCGFKANHHGSAHSNNATFLGRMRPAVCVTSAGRNEGWHLPSIPFIERLNTTMSITLPSDLDPFAPPLLKTQGFFFTNLYNFGGTNNSLTKAKSLFDAREKTAFSYGSKQDSIKKGYIVVSMDFDESEGIDYTDSSGFFVVPVNSKYETELMIAVIGCHKKE